MDFIFRLDDLQPELIAWNDRPAELDAVKRGEQDDSTRPERNAGGDQDAGGLGQGFDDQHTRHYRLSRPVTAKEWLVDAHVFDRHGPVPGIELEHPVDQKERIAVREQAHDARDVDHAVFRDARGRAAARADSRSANLLEQPARRAWLVWWPDRCATTNPWRSKPSRARSPTMSRIL